MNIQAERRGFALRGRRIDLNGQGFLIPGLRANVIHFCPAADDEIVYAAGKTGALRMGGTEMFHDRYLGKLFGDQKRVREDRGVRPVQPMEDLDGELDLDAARDVNERPRPDKSLVQRREFRRAKRRRLRHEVATE